MEVLLVATIVVLSFLVYAPQLALSFFGETINVSETPGSSTGPQVAVSNSGEIFVVWSDDTNSSGEIFFALSEDEGLSFSEPMNLSNDTSASSFPQLAVDGNNVYVVWQGSVNFEPHEVYFSTSLDGGNTFSGPTNLSNNTGTSVNAQIAFLGGSNVYVVWEDDDSSISSVPFSTDIAYRKSSDSGQSFGAINNISHNDGFSSSPRLAVSASGNVYVAWQDAEAGQAILFSASIDGNGSVFSEPSALSPLNGFALIADLRSSGSDNVHVSWSDFTGNSDVFLASSSNAGDSFTTINISQANPSISTTPQAAVAPDGKVWVVWNDDEAGSGDVFIANSTTNGLNFSDGLNLSNNDFPSSFPQIVISDNGASIYVVWQNALDIGGSQDIFFTGSLDDSETFSTPKTNVAINPELSESQVIAILDEKLLVVWTDSSSGNSEIMFRVVVLDVPSITIEPLSEENPSWGTSVNVTGIASNAGSDTVTVHWDDGSQNDDILVVDNTWTASHSYNSSGVGERTIVAELVSSEGIIDATSSAKTIIVSERASLLEIAGIGSVIQGDEVTVQGKLVDSVSGTELSAQTITFSGTGAVNIVSATTDDDGSFEAVAASPNSVSSLWIVQAHFAGSSAYKPSQSDVATYDTVSSSSSQFPISSGSPSFVNLSGFNATLTFDNVISDGVAYVSECDDEPSSNRYLSLDSCLEISSSAHFAAGSTGQVSISFAGKTIPVGHTTDEVDIFHEELSGMVDITEARDPDSMTVTGRTATFSKFVVGIALHEDQPLGAARQQVYVGSNQELVFYPMATIQLDSSVYDIGSSATLSINDENANLDELAVDIIAATVSSSSDRTGINIILSETGTDTGTFEGIFSLSSGTSSEDDARIQVEPGDDLEAKYVTQTGAPFRIVLDEVTESGMVQLSPYNVTGVPWPSIGNAYELDLIDATLAASSGVSITMSYADVDDLSSVGDPSFFIMVQRNDTSPEPNTWIDITSNTDTLQESVVGSTNTLSQYTITSSVFFCCPGGAGGGPVKAGVVVLDFAASVRAGSTSDENENSSGGSGGGSRSTGISQTPSGNNAEATVSTRSGLVTIKFESVQAESGQLKVEPTELSAFKEIFKEIIVSEQDNGEHGIVDLDGTAYSSAGNIFDIDLSINFEGMAEVTIPYDESAVISISGSESDVRFLHYDEEKGIWEDNTVSANALANTVTGRLDSLSPVLAAVIINQDVESIDQLVVSDPSFVISEVTGEITLSVNLSNKQQTGQNYVIIAQVLDQNNMVQHIEWQERSIAGAREEDISISWVQTEEGSYVVEVFIWTETENPSLLSQVRLPRMDV